jgi:signal transduction histidine kinase
MPLREIVEQLRESVAGRLEEHRLVVDLPTAEPLVVRADRDRLLVAVGHLLTNALRYAPTGPIVLRAGRLAEAVRIEVEDEGPGIPVNEQPRVWEKFYRGSSTAALNRARGAGIGLAVVKALVEAQGGRVGLTSVPGRGACFWFELPASGGAASGPTGSAASSQQPAG